MPEVLTTLQSLHNLNVNRWVRQLWKLREKLEKCVE